MIKDISSPFRLDDVRGVVAGRGGIVQEVAELRGDFAQAIGQSLCEGERLELLLAIRGDRVLRTDVPAAVLGLTDRALLVLREPPRLTKAPALGIRISILAYRALASIELGHSALRGALLFGILPATRIVPSFIASDVHGGVITIPYHTLDEQAIVDLVRRLRELSAI